MTDETNSQKGTTMGEQTVAIQTAGLTKRYGRKAALQDLSLAVPKGSVFALIGRNGAGKTTLIRTLLGLTAADGGTATVLGLNPAKQAVEIRRKVGFVPDEHRFPRWMSIGELTGFTSAFFPTWNAELCAELLARFKLDPKQKVKALSRGMLAQTALCLALAHEPEMLILDEPTSGLDAVVRREFLEQVLGAAADEGRTILISSHMLDELDRVADHVGYLEEGTLRLAETAESLKERVREYRLTFANEAPKELADPAWLSVSQVTPHEWTLTVENDSEDTQPGLQRRFPGASISSRELTLEEIFVALAQAPRQSGPGLE
jgi:ABC-2 type transport system ATP-binding protein